MHLGEEDSLLTNLKTSEPKTDPSNPSPVMENLVKCLKTLIEQHNKKIKPSLILNGDILELALSTTNQAAMVFERFIELVMPADGKLFDKIIYIPGNHDHHLWESARETQYINHMSKIKPGDELDVPWHTTRMFIEDDSKFVPSYMLTKLIQRYPTLKKEVIHVAYPNFAVLNKKGQKCVIFSHGHYVEWLYQLISTLRTFLFNSDMPDLIEEIEAENFAWIDFFWSTMGRSGKAGHDIELIYEKLHDEKQLKKLLSNLAKNLAEKYDLPGWGDKMEAKLLEWALHKLASKISGSERKQTDRVLSEDAEKGLWWYMNNPVRNQILGEHNKKMPQDVTFVFGHTHKPFEEDVNFKEYPQWVNVYNTGGWIVETVEPQPLHGGAVVLVDEDLNTTSLRMYNENSDPTRYSVEVREAFHSGQIRNPFHSQITGLVKPDKSPWKEFSASVARAVRVRAQNLRARINESV
jgi:UDP-2,3-diacylglucosamine pyrophosphatase LpxH